MTALALLFPVLVHLVSVGIRALQQIQDSFDERSVLMVFVRLYGFDRGGDASASLPPSAVP